TKFGKYLKYTDFFYSDSSYYNYTSSHTPNKDTNSGEAAFWKIFRNKFLFKLIFSNFKFKELFSYDDLNGSLYIFKKFSNGEAIFRDKIKSRNYVSRDFDDIESVIGKITKNTKENRDFYRQLFLIKKEEFSNYSYWVQVFVNVKNKAAFIEYNKLFQIDKRNISVKFNSNKTSLKLLKMKPFLESNGVLVTEWLSIYDVIKGFCYSHKFKELIKIYKFIISQNYQPKEKYDNIVQQLNHQLKTNQFNDIQLKSTIHTLSESNDQFLKPIIHNILKVIGSVYNLKFNDSKLLKPLHYYIYFKEKSRFRQVFTNRRYILSMFYNDLLKVTNSSQCIEYQKNLIISNKNEPRRRRQIEEAIISSHNLELIDFMFEHFGCPYMNICLVLVLIKKTEIIDYFFNNHKELLFYDNNTLWIYADSKVIDHLEELMKSISRKFLIPWAPEYLTYIPSNIDFFQRLEKALNNPTLYILEGNENIPTNSINRYNSYISPLNSKPDSFISMLENHLEKYGISEYFDIKPILKRIQLHYWCKFIYWIFQDLSDQYIQSNISNEELTIKSGINTTNNQKYEIKIKCFTNWQLLLFYCGRSNILFQNLNSNSQLKENLFKRINLFRANVFPNFLDHLSKSDFQSEWFRRLLIIAAKNGRFEPFKVISIKHEYLYYEKNDKSGLPIINSNHFSILKSKCVIDDLSFLSKYFK
ncbi:hypothetical protein DICPUDRAFT_149198, partial [Dictyostelium purpureum]